jgi:hypothetical protein
MNCLEFEMRLHEQFTPGQLEEGAEVVEHARRCPACRETLEKFRILSECLPAWREQVPDVDLTDAVVSAHELHEKRPLTRSTGLVAMPASLRFGQSRYSQSTVSAGIVARSPLPVRFRRQRAVWLAAVAAVGLLLVAIYFSRPASDSPPSVTQSPAAQVPDAGSNNSPVNLTGQEREVSADDRAAALPEGAGEVYYDLAQKAAGALGEVTVFVMPVSSPQTMTPRNEHPDRPTDWIGGLQHQLRPIGRSLDDAFDFLWQAGEAADG